MLQGEVGPCVARFEIFGDILELVVGAFGEESSELDRVVTAMAESRVLYLSRESGKPVRDGCRSAVLAQYRRQAACLTARLGNLGEGAKQAAGRRGKVL